MPLVPKPFFYPSMVVPSRAPGRLPTPAPRVLMNLKRFDDKNAVAPHERTHTGETPYAFPPLLPDRPGVCWVGNSVYVCGRSVGVVPGPGSLWTTDLLVPALAME